jgi:hypothetical protein
MTAVTELANEVGTSAACHALYMPRASYYRDRRKTSFPVVTASRPSPARALRPAEREAVLSCLHEERFQDRSPAAVCSMKGNTTVPFARCIACSNSAASPANVAIS